MIELDPTQVTEFLRESNAIEGVYDDDMLQQAHYAWEYLMGEDKMTPGVVLKTHKILMLHSNLMGNERGYYRECPVWIGGHEGIQYQRVPEAIKAWCKRMNTPHLINELGAKIAHVEYEKIHPFVDGTASYDRHDGGIY